MNTVIGEILPLALGVAISPIPIIAAILMLLSPKAKVTSIGFLIGWVLGIVVATVAFVLLASVLTDEDPEASAPIKGTVTVILAALLLLLAVKQWRGRPREGQSPAMPKWMAAIDKMTFGAALGLGFLLSAVNPKNLLMAAGAGVAIGSAAITGGETAVVVGIFTLIAGSTVAVPVVAYLVAADKLRAPLDRLREWLEKENAIIMAVLLLVIGVVLLGKGIAAF